MKVRYKNSGAIRHASKFNTTALQEVLTGDDSAYISDLDVWVEALGEWKDMHKAFADKDIITDNYNEIFFEPKTKEDKERGFTL